MEELSITDAGLGARAAANLNSEMKMGTVSRGFLRTGGSLGEFSRGTFLGLQVHWRMGLESSGLYLGKLPMSMLKSLSNTRCQKQNEKREEKRKQMW